MNSFLKERFCEKTINLIEFFYLKTIRNFTRLTPYLIYRNDPIQNFPVENFTALVRNIDYQFKPLEKSWELIINIDGKKRVARAFIERGFDPKKTTIIFHHGAGMINYKPLMNFYFNHPEFKKFNLIAIKAPCHESKADYTNGAIDSLYHQQLTIAGSVLITEEIIQWLKKQNSKSILIGFSMGGIVFTWHWLIFDSGDIYFPITAYPNISEIFLGDGYKEVIDKRSERLKISSYFKAFSVSQTRRQIDQRDRIFPVLGEKDLIINYSKALNFWKGKEVLHFPYGHFVSIVKSKQIKKYIGEKLTQRGFV